jgi:sugar lactone lactonase YvrE
MFDRLVVKKSFFVGLIIILLLTFYPQNPVVAQDSFPIISDYYFLNSWGGEGNQIKGPADVAIAPDGRLYIANAGFDRITIVDKEGFIYYEIGGFGEADGEFYLPLSLTINETGELFVADTWNRRLQKFDNAGNHLLTFGVFGFSTGEIYAPQALAIDAYGNLLVADVFKILKFSPNGEFLMEWGLGERGSGDYEFDHAHDVAVAGNGNIYVADGGNNRVQIFDSEANYLTTIDISNEYQSLLPEGVAIDAYGYLYVTANDMVFVYDTNDSNYPLIRTFGGSGTALGQLSGASGIYVVDATGEIIITEMDNNRVSIFNSSGEIVTAIGTPDIVDGYFSNPRDIAVVNNRVYVSDTFNYRIQVFNLDGAFLTQWGEWGIENGQFNEPWGIDADSAGNIFVADSNNNRLQKFDYLGNWITSTDLLNYYPSGCFDEYNESICFARDIVIDKDDNLFVNIQNYQGLAVIYKFDSAMNYQTQWEGGGNLAADSLGNIYATWANYVNVYSNDGIFIRRWGEGPGPYLGLGGIAIDIYDSVYVMDLWRGFINKFSNDGSLLGTYGQLGYGLGEFGLGCELDISNDGVLYIADAENQRIQAIGPNLPDPDPTTGLVLNGNFESSDIVSRVPKSNVLMKTVSLDTLPMPLSGGVPGLDNWVYGGALGVSRSSTNTYEGNYSLQLGLENAPAIPQGIGEAWASQVFYVPEDWTTPTLKFNYNIFTNDARGKSNFLAEIQDGIGLNNLGVIVLDGYEGGVPSVGTELGWKSVEYDLSLFRGQYIRLKFSNRNLYPDSLGIWAFVENVMVTNDSPPVANPGGPYLEAVNTSILFDGSLSFDPDGSPLTYTWDFGDGVTGNNTLSEHAYASSSIYDVCLTVNDGNSDSEPACTIAVVYDPTNGFITGGGWIISPAGAYQPDETLNGKAVFGFFSKYKKGANVPEGNTEFHFLVGNLSFQSTAYNWLVVSKQNATAQFKGSGLLNEALDPNGNPYKFMLWAGDETGTNGFDTFRIRIWWESDDEIEHIVYDNGVDQEIDGGNIVVHIGK